MSASDIVVDAGRRGQPERAIPFDVSLFQLRLSLLGSLLNQGLYVDL